MLLEISRQQIDLEIVLGFLQVNEAKFYQLEIAHRLFRCGFIILSSLDKFKQLTRSCNVLNRTNITKLTRILIISGCRREFIAI